MSVTRKRSESTGTSTDAEAERTKRRRWLPPQRLGEQEARRTVASRLRPVASRLRRARPLRVHRLSREATTDPGATGCFLIVALASTPREPGIEFVRRKRFGDSRPSLVPIRCSPERSSRSGGNAILPVHHLDRNGRPDRNATSEVRGPSTGMPSKRAAPRTVRAERDSPDGDHRESKTLRRERRSKGKQTDTRLGIPLIFCPSFFEHPLTAYFGPLYRPPVSLRRVRGSVPARRSSSGWRRRSSRPHFQPARGDGAAGVGPFNPPFHRGSGTNHPAGSGPGRLVWISCGYLVGNCDRTWTKRSDFGLRGRCPSPTLWQRKIGDTLQTRPRPRRAPQQGHRGARVEKRAFEESVRNARNALRPVPGGSMPLGPVRLGSSSGPHGHAIDRLNRARPYPGSTPGLCWPVADIPGC